MLVVLSADVGTEMKDNLLRSVAQVGWPQERIPLEQIIITLLKPPLSCRGTSHAKKRTGVPHLQETNPPQDPTVGLCLGS